MRRWLRRRITRAEWVHRFEAVGLERAVARQVVSECERERIDPARVLELVSLGSCVNGGEGVKRDS